MIEMTQHTKELLTAISNSDGATVRELEEMGLRTVDVRAAIKNLQRQVYVYGSQHGKTATLYSATRRGRLLVQSFALRVGEVAAPRVSTIGGPSFVPAPMRCQRPEGNRAFDIPSLGDEYRKRPVIIGAKVRPVGVRG